MFWYFCGVGGDEEGERRGERVGLIEIEMVGVQELSPAQRVLFQIS